MAANNKQVVSFIVDKDALIAFRNYCDQHGIRYSFLINEFMKERLNKE